MFGAQVTIVEEARKPQKIGKDSDEAIGLLFYLDMCCLFFVYLSYSQTHLSLPQYYFFVLSLYLPFPSLTSIPTPYSVRLDWRRTTMIIMWMRMGCMDRDCFISLLVRSSICRTEMTRTPDRRIVARQMAHNTFPRYPPRHDNPKRPGDMVSFGEFTMFITVLCCFFFRLFSFQTRSILTNLAGSYQLGLD